MVCRHTGEERREERVRYLGKSSHGGFEYLSAHIEQYTRLLHFPQLLDTSGFLQRYEDKTKEGPIRGRTS
jgi:hypothetical protein